MSTFRYRCFRRDFRRWTCVRRRKCEQPDEEARRRRALLPVPAWVTVVHLAFMAWTVVNAHYPALFIGGFMFFLGFARATSHLSSPGRLADAAAGRFLPGRPGHSRRPAGVVDCAGARQADAAPLFFGAMS